MQHWAFWVWVPLLTVMFSVKPHASYFTVFMTKLYSIVWVHYNLCIHQLMDVGLYSLWATVKTAAEDILVQVFVWPFHLGRCLGVELVDYKSSVLYILRNCQVVLQDGYSNYYIHPRTVQGLSTLINILDCLSTIYKGILVGMTSSLTVLLMDISLITNSVEHLFMCLLGICVSLRNVYAHTSFVSF